MPGGRPPRSGLDPATIDLAGRLLFGVRYKRQLADLLTIKSEDTISRWVAGKMRPATDARLEIAQELERRMLQIPEVIAALKDGLDEPQT